MNVEHEQPLTFGIIVQQSKGMDEVLKMRQSKTKAMECLKIKPIWLMVLLHFLLWKEKNKIKMAKPIKKRNDLKTNKRYWKEAKHGYFFFLNILGLCDLFNLSAIFTFK